MTNYELFANFDSATDTPSQKISARNRLVSWARLVSNFATPLQIAGCRPATRQTREGQVDLAAILAQILKTTGSMVGDYLSRNQVEADSNSKTKQSNIEAGLVEQIARTNSIIAMTQNDAQFTPPIRGRLRTLHITLRKLGDTIIRNEQGTHQGLQSATTAAFVQISISLNFLEEIVIDRGNRMHQSR